jgi:hypothetical protein
VHVVTRTEVLRRIVERTDLEQFTERVLESFWQQPEFQRLHPPREEVRAWVRWNLDLVIRWLVDGHPPTDAELDLLREQARARAADGFAADIVPANYRRGARFAWSALLEAANEQERAALVDSADLLFEYVDRVSRIFFEVYEAEPAVRPGTEEERAAGALLARIDADDVPLPEDHLLAERVGFQLDRAARPFVIAVPERSAQYHSELAAQLRRHGALAVSEGRRVVALANARSPWRRLELDPGAIIAQAAAAIRGERGRALDELRTVAEIALASGRSGLVEASDYLPELLLRRSPRTASQIRVRIYGPLDAGYPELARTLDLLVEHCFERGATAAALPVHRNTLRDRISRISEITGIDLDHVDGRGLAWLAWLDRRDSPSGRQLPVDG